ncbi:MAG: radical SAM family heme chaperone HemW, partial [Candidatus Tectomicrobia bacterium]|nr:radical SAM family heme chaperone HemW [Candidatus Tectomicrobia bacterium]
MPPGLYIHIPFCASRCPYCDFAFVVGKTYLADLYADTVIREFRARLPEVGTSPVFETIYFGGGTPSTVPVEVLGRILNVVRTERGVTENAEITAEANPGDRPRFAALRELGINRLSLGVQALDDQALKALGRLHNAADAEAAFEAARCGGFQNINLDLIFGIPKQSLEDWLATLDRAIELHPEHLSIYGLTIEVGTAFGRRFERGRLSLPSESDQAAMYEAALDRLMNQGYEQYEVSNFARPGFESRHNLSYWEGVPYLGIGVSAHSFLNGCRSW